MNYKKSRDRPETQNQIKSLFICWVVVLVTVGVLGFLSSFTKDINQNDKDNIVPNDPPKSDTTEENPSVETDPNLIDFENYEIGAVTLPIGGVILPQNHSGSQSSVEVVTDYDGDKALQINGGYLAFEPYDVDNGDTENNVTVFSMDMSLELNFTDSYKQDAYSEYIRFYSGDGTVLQFKFQLRNYDPETAFRIINEKGKDSGFIEVASSDFNFRVELYNDGYLRFLVNDTVLHENYYTNNGGIGRILWEHDSNNVVRIDNVTIQNTYIQK